MNSQLATYHLAGAPTAPNIPIANDTGDSEGNSRMLSGKHLFTACVHESSCSPYKVAS